MRKFKHKKTGYEVSQDKGGFTYVSEKYGNIHYELIENSNDWEEITECIHDIKEYPDGRKYCRSCMILLYNPLRPNYKPTEYKKDYEILSFKEINGDKRILIRDSQLKDTFCFKDGLCPFYKLDELIKNPIHSVKRLSDGEIFTIGDDILEQNEHSKIEYFEILDDFLRLRINHQVTKGSSTIMISSKFEKYIPKKPLFVTEDGVDIFAEERTIHQVCLSDHYYATSSVNYQTGKYKDLGYYTHNKHWKFFSTKEAAEDYIILNKPCLNALDVLEYIHSNKPTVLANPKEYIHNGKINNFSGLKELIKSKLNL